MGLEHDMRFYRARWQAVEEIQAEERRSASLELRWRQLNAAYGIAQGLGLVKPDPGEMEVYQRWANLKNQASDQTPLT